MSDVREYAILYLNGRLLQGGGGAVGLGGTAVLSTRKHRLDGPEHLDALDTTTLDTSTTRHGLAPKLSGDPGDVWRGDGTWGPSTSPGGMVPYFIDIGDTFTVPLYYQALYAVPIDVDGTLAINGILAEVD